MSLRKTRTSMIGIVALLALFGCGHATTKPATMPAHSQHAEQEHHEDNSLPLPKRLAFMTGHVEAGLALYRAGEPAMAAKHLQHPVSETHASERVGLDALGFNAELFIAVSKALNSGVPAAQIEPQLKAAKQNLLDVSDRAGGDTSDIISYLLDTVVEEYAIGVQNGVVTDPGEYQDAFGFTQVAIDRASGLPAPQRNEVITRLNALLDAWPPAPVPPQNPASVERINRLVKSVREAL